MDAPPQGLTAPSQRAAVDLAVRRAMDELVRLPGVVRVGLAITEGGGRRLLFTASDRDAADGRLVEWCHIDAYDDVPLTAAVRTGSPVVGDLDTLAQRYSDLVQRQRARAVGALAAVPLMGSGPPVGGMVLFYAEPQDFDEVLCDDLVRRAAEVAESLREAQATAPREGPRLAEHPVPDGVAVSDLTVGADPRAVGDTRRHLRSALSDWGVDDDTAETAVLCLSEVVTNAVIHTHAPSELRITLERGVLTVTVRDRGAATWSSDPRSDPDPLRVHGRGLQVLEVLADRWGSELDAVGTTVWFVLETGDDDRRRP